jgi:hypothetical protein
MNVVLQSLFAVEAFCDEAIALSARTNQPSFGAFPNDYLKFAVLAKARRCGAQEYVHVISRLDISLFIANCSCFFEMAALK